MAQAGVSSKYQVVIPKPVRMEVGLESGQVVQVIARSGVITLVPDRPIAALRGFLKGMRKTGVREKQERS